MGAGVFGMKQYNKVNIYGGLRFESAMIKWDEEGYNGNVTHSVNRLMIGPAIGCEYYLVDNFSVGAEISIKYAELKTNVTPSSYINTDEGDYYFTTDTGVLIHFYF